MKRRRRYKGYHLFVPFSPTRKERQQRRPPTPEVVVSGYYNKMLSTSFYNSLSDLKYKWNKTYTPYTLNDRSPVPRLHRGSCLFVPTTSSPIFLSPLHSKRTIPKVFVLLKGVVSYPSLFSWLVVFTVPVYSPSPSLYSYTQKDQINLHRRSLIFLWVPSSLPPKTLW